MARPTKRRHSSASRSRKRPRSKDRGENEGSDGSLEANTPGSSSTTAIEQSTSDEPKDAVAKFNARWKVGEWTDEEILGKVSFTRPR